MAGGLHKNALEINNHIPVALGPYADTAALTAAADAVVGDIGKLALQTDTGQLWRMTGFGPATWEKVDTSAVHVDSAAEISAVADKAAPAGADYLLLEDSAAADAKKSASITNVVGAAPPQAHDTSHENGGGDEISVAGLSGELADDQPPKAHAIDGATHTGLDLGVNAYYVGKHGNDGNSGKSWLDAFLTFGAAITAATGETPATDKRFSIVCQDGGTYTENIACVAWVSIHAPAARLVGKLTTSDDMVAEFSTYYNAADNAVVKTAGSAGSTVIAHGGIEAAGAHHAVVNSTASFLLVTSPGLASDTGDAVLNDTAAGTTILDVGLLFKAGVGAALHASFAGSKILGTARSIVAPSGDALHLDAGNIDMVIAAINALGAYDVAVGAQLDLIVGDMSGTETNLGTANVIRASQAIGPLWSLTCLYATGVGRVGWETSAGADSFIATVCGTYTDATNALIRGFAFDDTIKEGALINELVVPAKATTIEFATDAAALAGPAGAVAAVMTIAIREIADGAAVGAWTEYSLLTIDLPITTTYYHKDTTGAVALAAFGMAAGKKYQAQVMRDTAGNTLVSDLNIRTMEITVR